MSEVPPPRDGADSTPHSPASSVRIYDRPERKGVSPLVLGIGVIVLLVVAFLLYQMFFHPTALPVRP